MSDVLRLSYQSMLTSGIIFCQAGRTRDLWRDRQILLRLHHLIVPNVCVWEVRKVFRVPLTDFSCWLFNRHSNLAFWSVVRDIAQVTPLVEQGFEEIGWVANWELLLGLYLCQYSLLISRLWWPAFLHQGNCIIVLQMVEFRLVKHHWQAFACSEVKIDSKIVFVVESLLGLAPIYQVQAVAIVRVLLHWLGNHHDIRVQVLFPAPEKLLGCHPSFNGWSILSQQVYTLTDWLFLLLPDIFWDWAFKCLFLRVVPGNFKVAVVIWVWDFLFFSFCRVQKEDLVAALVRFDVALLEGTARALCFLNLFNQLRRSSRDWFVHLGEQNSFAVLSSSYLMFAISLSSNPRRLVSSGWLDWSPNGLDSPNNRFLAIIGRLNSSVLFTRDLLARLRCGILRSFISRSGANVPSFLEKSIVLQKVSVWGAIL